jgi:hypothetical protein
MKLSMLFPDRAQQAVHLTVCLDLAHQKHWARPLLHSSSSFATFHRPDKNKAMTGRQASKAAALLVLNYERTKWI